MGGRLYNCFFQSFVQFKHCDSRWALFIWGSVLAGYHNSLTTKSFVLRTNVELNIYNKKNIVVLKWIFDSGE